MPKRKRQKIKKKKGNKGKKSKQQSFCIPLSLVSNCKDKVMIEVKNAKNAESVIFIAKLKGMSLECTDNASDILLQLDENGRLDIICDIASWCCSFDKDKRDDTKFWAQYIKNINVNKISIKNSIQNIIIEQIQNIMKECLNNYFYYYHGNNISKIANNKLSDFELNIVIYTYLKKYIPQIHKYIIPTDVTDLFCKYYGHLSDLVFDTKLNILTTSINADERKAMSGRKNNSPFIFYRKYALLKQGWILDSDHTTYFNFTMKGLDKEQIIGLAMVIYDESMSNDLTTGQWVFDKDKYFKQIETVYQKLITCGINDIYTINGVFSIDFKTEFTRSWILKVELYKNALFMRSTVRTSDDVTYDVQKYKNIKRRCHLMIIMDTRFEEDRFLKLQMIKSEHIPDSIKNSIKWTKHLQGGQHDYVDILDDPQSVKIESEEIKHYKKECELLKSKTNISTSHWQKKKLSSYQSRCLYQLKWKENIMDRLKREESQYKIKRGYVEQVDDEKGILYLKLEYWTGSLYCKGKANNWTYEQDTCQMSWDNPRLLPSDSECYADKMENPFDEQFQYSCLI